MTVSCTSQYNSQLISPKVLIQTVLSNNNFASCKTKNDTAAGKAKQANKSIMNEADDYIAAVHFQPSTDMLQPFIGSPSKTESCNSGSMNEFGRMSWGSFWKILEKEFVAPLQYLSTKNFLSTCCQVFNLYRTVTSGASIFLSTVNNFYIRILYVCIVIVR